MYRLHRISATFARLTYHDGPYRQQRHEEGESMYSLDTKDERTALLSARDVLNTYHGGLWYFVVTGEIFPNGDARNIGLATRWSKETCFMDVDAALSAAQPRIQVFTPINRYR